MAVISCMQKLMDKTAIIGFLYINQVKGRQKYSVSAKKKRCWNRAISYAFFGFQHRGRLTWNPSIAKPRNFGSILHSHLSGRL